VVGAIVLAIPPLAAAQATRYAEPGGNGDPTMCLESDPCSLDAAVEDPAVQDGDEVIVLPGTYDSLTSDTLTVTDRINLHGENGAPRPLITESTSVATVFSPNLSNLSVHDLEVANTSSGNALSISGFPSAGLEATVSRVVATASGTNTRACDLFATVIRDSVCRNTSTGVGAGVSVGGASLSNVVTMRNVTVISAGPAISVSAASSAVVPWDLKNVVARGTPTDIVATQTNGGSATITLANSNYATESENGGAAITDPGSGTNQIAPPQFVDAPSGDFRQLPTSPTRNAGVADGLGPTDLEGDPRTLEGLPDIGADEFAADGDADGVKDYADNCPTADNSGQQDADGDGIGDACDPTPNGDSPPGEGGEVPGPDAAAPDTTITAGPEGTSKKKTATFSFSGTDARAVASFQCKLDTGSFEPCTSPKTYSGLKKGSHTVSVRAVDSAGNVDPTPATRTWKVKKKRKKK
jgi:hypothetical protein